MTRAMTATTSALTPSPVSPIADPTPNTIPPAIARTRGAFRTALTAGSPENTRAPANSATDPGRLPAAAKQRQEFANGSGGSETLLSSPDAEGDPPKPDCHEQCAGKVSGHAGAGGSSATIDAFDHDLGPTTSPLETDDRGTKTSKHNSAE